MKLRRLFRVALYLLAVWNAWRLWGSVQDDPILALLFFIICGAILGLWVAKVVLPWMAEAFATSIFMSGGNVTPESEDPAKPDEQGREDEVKEEAPADRQDKDPS